MLFNRNDDDKKRKRKKKETVFDLFEQVEILWIVKKSIEDIYVGIYIYGVKEEQRERWKVETKSVGQIKDVNEYVSWTELG